MEEHEYDPKCTFCCRSVIITRGKDAQQKWPALERKIGILSEKCHSLEIDTELPERKKQFDLVQSQFTQQQEKLNALLEHQKEGSG